MVQLPRQLIILFLTIEKNKKIIDILKYMILLFTINKKMSFDKESNLRNDLQRVFGWWKKIMMN